MVANTGDVAMRRIRRLSGATLTYISCLAPSPVALEASASLRGRMVQSDLVLDSAVRDWVLLPLTLSVALMMVLRQYMSKARLPCLTPHWLCK